MRSINKFIFIGLITVILVSNVYAYDFQEGEKNWKKWIACTTDDQCIPIEGVCSRWEVVNKQFKIEGEEYQSNLQSAAKCRDVGRSLSPKVGCVEQECSIQINSPSLVETGPNNICVKDSDCWCRKFTGAEWMPGKTKSKCQNDQCIRCLYE